jgi:Zn-dependent M28 family amino/carboxypeptidase
LQISPSLAANVSDVRTQNPVPLAVEDSITLDHLITHLKNFQTHADQNSSDFQGTRFTGTTGQQASQDYVLDLLKSAGYRTWSQDVPYEITWIKSSGRFEQTAPIARSFVSGEDYAPLAGSGGGNVTGVVSLPSGGVWGCNKEDFSGFPAGHIALIQRGGNCYQYRDKVFNAMAAGASGVIIANNVPGVMFTSLGTPVPSMTTPVVMVSGEVAKELADAIQKGQSPTVHFDFEAVRKAGVSQNIFAELTGVDDSHVVMAGAHLDSSPGNAGMNDNASAAAAILEVALQMKDIKPSNTLRFAWWTGEEMGLEGSIYYIKNLPDKEKKRIAVYINHEILGAPNGGRFIMGTDDTTSPPGSKEIVERYMAYFTSMGLSFFVIDPMFANAGVRSDMLPFIQAGIPSSFIVTGAEIPWNPVFDEIFQDLKNRKSGVATHPCYHKSCDRLSLKADGSDDNFDFDLYLQMSKATAFVISRYAMNS